MYRDPDRFEDIPPHPGEVLREDILPRLGLSRRELARRLKISDRVLAEFVGERIAVTPDLGSRLGIVLGHGVRYWIGLQAQHDLWQAIHHQPAGIRPIVWRKNPKPNVQPAASMKAA